METSSIILEEDKSHREWHFYQETSGGRSDSVEAEVKWSQPCWQIYSTWAEKDKKTLSAQNTRLNHRRSARSASAAHLLPLWNIC